MDSKEIDRSEYPVEFTGILIDKLFGPGRNNFYILKMRVGGKSGTVKGSMPSVTMGMAYKIKGTSKYDDVRQERFVWISKAEEIPDATPIGIINYLTNECPQVGEVAARRMVDKWGQDTLEKICDPVLVSQEIDGFNLDRALAVANWGQSEKSNRATKQKLYAIGITTGQVKKLIEKYGADAEEKIRRDCFKITEIDGIGYLTAAKIADLLGVPKNDPGRLRAGIVYSFEEFFNQGHVCVRRSDLVRAACDLTGATQQAVNEQVNKLIEFEKLVDSGNTKLIDFAGIDSSWNFQKPGA